LLPRQTKDFTNLAHLIALEGNSFLRVLLRLLSLKDGTKGQQFGENATYSPQVDCGCVMPASEQELWGTVPDCHDNLIACEEGVQRLVEEAGEAEIADFDASAGCYHDVCGFEIAVDYPILMEVEEA
jgi:hypothetical protein